MISILYVDDESAMRDILKRFLEKEYREIEVVAFESGFEALEELRKRRFDIIISDYRMPGMNGLEFLREIKSSGLSEAPFILYTTDGGNEQLAKEVLAAGACFVYTKGGDPPLCYTELLGKILEAIHDQRKEEEAEYVFTEDMLSENLESSLINYLNAVMRHLKAKGALLTILANSKKIDLHSSDFSLTEEEISSITAPSDKLRSLRGLNVLTIELTVGRSELGFLHAFAEHEFKDGLAPFTIVGSTISSMLLEKISKPDE